MCMPAENPPTKSSENLSETPSAIPSAASPAAPGNLARDLPADPPKRVPLVTYLALDPQPHLLAWECTACSARFFDRRNACAACGAASFVQKPVSTTGELRAFSVVHRAAKKIKVPFVAALVEADDGTMIRSNLLVEPTPEKIVLPMPVRLVTYVVGADSRGSECVAFAFEPQETCEPQEAEAPASGGRRETGDIPEGAA